MNDYRLLPYQLDAVLQSRASNLLVLAHARRIGATYPFACDAVDTVVSTLANTYFYVNTLARGRVFLMECCVLAEMNHGARLAVEPVSIGEGDEPSVQCWMVQFPGGGIIYAVPPMPSLLRTANGPIVIDDAAWVPNLSHLIAPALAATAYGARVVVISALPKKPGNAFMALLADVQAGRKAGVAQMVTLSDAVTGGLYRRICEIMGVEYTATGEASWEARQRQAYGMEAASDLDLVI
ncbi:hypothetical protein [Sphingobium aquiterrae]|uniref:hypothetical protein n=1 Tax=Sphingobium aquiterrae TaxID=2038656 RepID=UPI003016C1C2